MLLSSSLEPNAGNALDFLDPCGLSDRTAKPPKQMDVIFHTADDDRGASQLFGDTSNVCVQIFSTTGLAQKRAAILRGEDEVDIHG